MKYVFWLLLFSGLTACTSSKETESKAQTFVYCSEGSPKTFNPQLATDGPTFNASSSTVYNRLMEFEIGTTDLEPSLAESYEAAKDGKSFTFKLRKDVPFHSTADFKPSRNLNADDVIFSFDRMRNKENPYHNVSGGTYEYFSSMEMGTIIEDIKKIDDHTVQFVLSRKEAPFVANLAMDFASILSKEYADKMMEEGTPEKLDTHPVGTGPFVFDRYVKDSQIRYKAFEKYFAGLPKIKNLVFSITTDPSVRFQKLKAGECHLIAEPAPQDLEQMKKLPSIQVLDREGLNVGYLAMNTAKKPLDNEKVREAINHALNKESYINAIYLGHATKAINPIPPTMWSYNEQVEDYDYDPEKAKRLLAEAGYPEGFNLQLWTLPVSRPYNPNGKKMGELMQADLKKVGINIELVSYDWPTYLAKSRRGEHDLLQLGWTGDNGDPDNFLAVLLGCAAVEAGSNTARWCNEEFDQKINQAKQTTDLEERTKLYKEAQVIFKDKAPWVTLAHARVYRALSDKVEGYKIHPFGTESFENVELK